jgi:hypothetical protein
MCYRCELNGIRNYSLGCSSENRNSLVNQPRQLQGGKTTVVRKLLGYSSDGQTGKKKEDIKAPTF